MSSYQCMYLVPKSIYNAYLNHNSPVKEALSSVYIRQMNNLDVNPGAAVTIRNDDNYVKEHPSMIKDYALQENGQINSPIETNVNNESSYSGGGGGGGDGGGGGGGG